jgi:hypothetical protein
VKARAPVTERLELETLPRLGQQVGPKVDRPHVTVLAVPDKETLLGGGPPIGWRELLFNREIDEDRCGADLRDPPKELVQDGRRQPLLLLLLASLRRRS